MQQQPTIIADNEPDGLSRFLWWLAAADGDILKDCKADKERYRIVGIAVLVTGCSPRWHGGISFLLLLTMG
ncbi:hypothetical protein MKQ70_04915 [Chitinophaga sedimenti]|uniref:hypothetical protein n=1 Tax=Chitinophaga sedimenti TaxID=2033606 RepID=UPI002002A6F9|nr:hypothetical protein [Chitinophaga sedimenti]MCK7554381.1 hypothetical protein [Chitinophaga sedimenti]